MDEPYSIAMTQQTSMRNTRNLLTASNTYAISKFLTGFVR